LANVRAEQNQIMEAIEHSDRAVEIFRNYYTPKVFPRGHKALASLLFWHGLIQYRAKDYAGAALVEAESARMNQELALHILPGLSEAESLNFVFQNLDLSRVVFDAWEKTQREPAELYEIVWNRRGLVMRLLQQRNLAIRSTVSTQMAQSYRDFEQASRALSKALLAGSPADQLAKLTELKEAKERAMAELIPGSDKLRQSGRSFRDLHQLLPANCAYVEIARSNGTRESPSNFSCFVLTAGRPVAMVSLPDVKAIRETIVSFRTAITEGKPVAAEARVLREQIWEPIEKAFPEKIETVFICPDGELTAIPWSMLPGRGEESVLLEDYAVAAVPSGHVLLDQISNPQRDPKKMSGKALIVGDLAFDDQNTGSPAPGSHPILRAAVRGDTVLHWTRLPGTAQELDGIMALDQDHLISVMRGNDAAISRVLQELPQVHWAHFATHGYFADPKLQTKSDTPALVTKRSTAAARNPQLLSGIVLSGANQPQQVDAAESGILTAEAISMLPLEQLQLVVLSACETGAGDVADGEGVLGLQRAFHLAGARNVVASLWKVDDRATAVLMKLFYENCWTKGQPPIQALRDAQLTLYRNPALIEADLEHRVRGVRVTKTETPGANTNRKTTDPRLWASFILSGRGD
jgi:CHAT domain-containing protein